jgi:aerotaxis receptor
MKRNLPVTDTQVSVRPDQQLISSTDLKGVITYCNRDFVEISGFAEEELIGSSHNIVRHPDMPPAAFAEMWETLRAGKPWMGLVKNRTKQGGFYWVDAYVTPVFEGERVVGYESVRVAPRAEDVERAQLLYNKLNARGKVSSMPTLGVANALGLVNSLVLVPVMAALNLFAGLPWLAAALAWLVASVVAWAVISRGLAPLMQAVGLAREIFNSPLSARIYSGRRGDLGVVLLGLFSQRARLRTVLGRVADSTEELDCRVERGHQIAGQMASAVDSQQRDIGMLATAMEQMSMSVSEVAQNATDASQSTQLVRSRAQAGKTALRKAVNTTKQVASEIEAVAETVRKLEESSGAIDTVLVVIRDIAEQTNLLALNAAIEAARAGEQGRGFAVVADEVRTLASRSRASTEEIQSTIERLQADARSAVSAMAESHRSADMSVEQADQVGGELDDIFAMVEQLESMNLMIATAAEQQSNVSSEITRNVQQISDSAATVKDESDDAQQLASDIRRLSEGLSNLIRRFR